MSGNVVFVTITEYTTIHVPTSFATLPSSQRTTPITEPSSTVLTSSELISSTNPPAGTGTPTSIPPLPTEFAPPTPSSTQPIDTYSPTQSPNANLVQSLALAALILVILLYLSIILAFILFWIRKECPKCQNLGAKLRNRFRKQDAGISELDLEGQKSKSASRHSAWPGSREKERADSVMGGFETASAYVSYPRPMVLRRDTAEMLRAAAEGDRRSEEVRDPFSDGQYVAKEVDGSRGRPYGSPGPGFVSCDNLVNYGNRTPILSQNNDAADVGGSSKVARGPLDDGEEPVQRRPRYDSDGFLRITPPRVLATTGLLSKAVGRSLIKSGEIVKLEYRRDSQGVWGLLPSLYPPLAAPRVDESSNTDVAQPLALSRTPTNDSLAQPCRTAAYEASRSETLNAKAAKQEHDRLEKIRKDPNSMQTVDLD